MELLEQYEAKKVRVIGVSNDDQSKNTAFARECGFSFPLICDVDLSVSVAYGAAKDKSAGKADRIAVLVNRDGVVEQIWQTVDAKTFPQTCLDGLKEPPPPPEPYVKPGLSCNMDKMPPELKLTCEFCGFKWNTRAVPHTNKGECPKCLGMPTSKAA
jgi:hypothetical protein